MRDLLFQVSLEEKQLRQQEEEDRDNQMRLRARAGEDASRIGGGGGDAVPGAGADARAPMTFDGLILKRLGALSGLDAVSFAKCLHSERHIDEIRRLTEIAHRLGVRGTPYFVFDRRMHPDRPNRFQDLHTHREGVVQQEEVRRLLWLDLEEAEDGEGAR